MWQTGPFLFICYLILPWFELVHIYCWVDREFSSPQTAQPEFEHDLLHHNCLPFVQDSSPSKDSTPFRSRSPMSRGDPRIKGPCCPGKQTGKHKQGASLGNRALHAAFSMEMSKINFMVWNYMLLISADWITVILVSVPYKFYILGQIGLSKQWRPRSDCFFRTSLIRVYAVCHSISIFWMH